MTSHPNRQSYYRSFLPAIRETARACGYAIGVHGSEHRDFDLIAAPWTDSAVTSDDCAKAIADAVGGEILCRAQDQIAGVKPLGRRAYTIIWGGDVDAEFPHPDGWAVFIDLSVMPGAGK